MKRTIGSYQLQRRLGVGGMAEVFFATARRPGDFEQPCVVKVLHDELTEDRKFSEMLLEEARLVAGLRHNNIASLYDVGRIDDQVFLVMEFVDGHDLHSILVQATETERQLPFEFATHVARDVCAGLHFAHTRCGDDGTPLDLVHRDVSPPNVLVSSLGEVKLIDFGIAKFNSEAREKTQTGIIKGKFGYMSPEQAWNEELDGRSDVFSVGVCLYEMLTGRSLYGQSDDAMTLLRRAREAEIDPITNWRSDIPEQLATIVHTALAADRDQRYDSAHHMERALAGFLAQFAPGYTALDAGRFLDELFDIADPAVEAMADAEYNRQGSTSPDELSGSEQTSDDDRRRSVDDETRPIGDIPDEVKRRVDDDSTAAGSSPPPTNSSGPSNLLDADLQSDTDDFSPQTTQVIGEKKLAPENERSPDSPQADTKDETIQQTLDDDIDDDIDETIDCNIDATIETTDFPASDDDPTPAADKTRQFVRWQNDSPDESSSPTVADQPPADPERIPVQPRQSPKATDQVETLRRERPAPRLRSSSEDDEQQLDTDTIERRIQIACGVVFVLIALVFMLSRLM